MGLFLWVRRHGSNTKSHQTQRDVSMTLLQVCHKLWIFVADNHDSLMEALSQLLRGLLSVRFQPYSCACTAVSYLSVSGLEKRLGEYSGRQLSNLKMQYPTSSWSFPLTRWAKHTEEVATCIMRQEERRHRCRSIVLDVTRQVVDLR